MGWCKELIHEAKEKKISLEKELAALEELIPMIEWAYEQNPSYWADHKDKAECHVYGYHFTKDCAERAVAEMQNDDGSVGQYWSIKDVKDLAETMQIDFSKEKFNLYDLYYTLNMERSDFYDANANPQFYIERAFRFLRDKDGPEGKAKKYYLMIKGKLV